MASPCDLFRLLLVGSGFLILYSLPGPLDIKQLMRMVTVVPGQGGCIQSLFPLT